MRNFLFRLFSSSKPVSQLAPVNDSATEKKKTEEESLKALSVLVEEKVKKETEEEKKSLEDLSVFVAAYLKNPNPPANEAAVSAAASSPASPSRVKKPTIFRNNSAAIDLSEKIDSHITKFIKKTAVAEKEETTIKNKELLLKIADVAINLVNTEDIPETHNPGKLTRQALLQKIISDFKELTTTQKLNNAILDLLQNYTGLFQEAEVREYLQITNAFNAAISNFITEYKKITEKTYALFAEDASAESSVVVATPALSQTAAVNSVENTLKEITKLGAPSLAMASSLPLSIKSNQRPNFVDGLPSDDDSEEEIGLLLTDDESSSSDGEPPLRLRIPASRLKIKKHKSDSEEKKDSTHANAFNDAAAAEFADSEPVSFIFSAEKLESRTAAFCAAMPKDEKTSKAKEILKAAAERVSANPQRLQETKVSITAEEKELARKYLKLVLDHGGETFADGKTQKALYIERGILPDIQLKPSNDQITDAHIANFYARLIKDRPLVFFNPTDTVTQKTGLKIHQYKQLFYTEMHFSASLMVSGPTGFINDGQRSSQGKKATSDNYEKDGYQAAVVGCRLSDNGSTIPEMERLFLIEGHFKGLLDERVEEEKVADFGGLRANSSIKEAIKGVSTGFLRGIKTIWDDFYDAGVKEKFPPKAQQADAMAAAAASDSPSQPLAQGQINEAKLQYALYIRIKKYITESITFNKEKNQNAYIRLTGIGDGFWAGEYAKQTQKAYGLAVRKVVEELSSEQKSYLAAIEFSQFGHETCFASCTDGIENTKKGHSKATPMVGNSKEKQATLGGVKIFSNQDSQWSGTIKKDHLSHLKDGRANKLCINFGWDGGSYIGNEFYDGSIAASADPVGVSASDDGITKNPDLNPHLLARISVIAKDGKSSSAINTTAAVFTKDDLMPVELVAAKVVVEEEEVKDNPAQAQAQAPASAKAQEKLAVGPQIHAVSAAMLEEENPFTKVGVVDKRFAFTKYPGISSNPAGAKAEAMQSRDYLAGQLTQDFANGSKNGLNGFTVAAKPNETISAANPLIFIENDLLSEALKAKRDEVKIYYDAVGLTNIAKGIDNQKIIRDIFLMKRSSIFDEEELDEATKKPKLKPGSHYPQGSNRDEYKAFLARCAPYVLYRFEAAQTFSLDAIGGVKLLPDGDIRKQSRPFYYNYLPNLDNHVPNDRAEFCIGSNNNRKITRPTALLERYKAAIKLQLTCAAANKEGCFITEPNAFFYGLGKPSLFGWQGDDEQEKGRKIFLAAAISAVEEFSRSSLAQQLGAVFIQSTVANEANKGFGIVDSDHNDAETMFQGWEEIAEKVVAIKNIKLAVTSNIDSASPNLYGQCGKVAQPIMGDATGRVGNMAFAQDQAANAAEENLTRQAPEILCVIDPKFNDNLINRLWISEHSHDVVQVAESFASQSLDPFSAADWASEERKEEAEQESLPILLPASLAQPHLSPVADTIAPALDQAAIPASPQAAAVNGGEEILKEIIRLRLLSSQAMSEDRIDDVVSLEKKIAALAEQIIPQNKGYSPSPAASLPVREEKKDSYDKDRNPDESTPYPFAQYSFQPPFDKPSAAEDVDRIIQAANKRDGLTRDEATGLLLKEDGSVYPHNVFEILGVSSEEILNPNYPKSLASNIDAIKKQIVELDLESAQILIPCRIGDDWVSLQIKINKMPAEAEASASVEPKEPKFKADFVVYDPKSGYELIGLPALNYLVNLLAPHFETTVRKGDVGQIQFKKDDSGIVPALARIDLRNGLNPYQIEYSSEKIDFRAIDEDPEGVYLKDGSKNPHEFASQHDAGASYQLPENQSDASPVKDQNYGAAFALDEIFLDAAPAPAPPANQEDYAYFDLLAAPVLAPPAALVPAAARAPIDAAPAAAPAPAPAPAAAPVLPAVTEATAPYRVSNGETYATVKTIDTSNSSDESTGLKIESGKLFSAGKELTSTKNSNNRRVDYKISDKITSEEIKQDDALFKINPSTKSVEINVSEARKRIMDYYHSTKSNPVEVPSASIKLLSAVSLSTIIAAREGGRGGSSPSA